MIKHKESQQQLQMSKPSKKLQDIWNKKLLKSGFVDAETSHYSEPWLKRWDSYYALNKLDRPGGLASDKFPGIDTKRFRSKREYYRLAEHYANAHIFQSVFCKLVWTNHSEGLSIREIVKIMQDKGFTAFKNQVNKIIRDNAAIMIDQIDPEVGWDE